MKDFRTLKVWQQAHRITPAVYKQTRDFPREELYGLTSQIRRASSSIAANIAEGAGRKGDAELARFFQIAFGSTCELEYHLLLSRDLKFFPEEEYKRVADEVVQLKKMLASFLNKLTADS